MAIDLGLVTAYAYAVAGGYEGTEAEFEQLLGDIANDLSEIENLSVVANTLPAGSSATASYSDGVLTLGIPRGDTGATGAGATVAAGTTTTGAEGTNASVTNSGTSKDAVFNFTIPRGNTGNGIVSITHTGTSGAVKTYTILFTDGNTTTFEVTDGEVTEAQLESVLEDYARIDGYYEDLTAGYAENLISNVYDEENVPYNFRTAGGSLDIGSFEYDEIVGGSLPINQLVEHGNFDEITGWGAYNANNSVSDNILSSVSTATNTFGHTVLRTPLLPLDHKYLVKVNAKSENATNGRVRYPMVSPSQSMSANTWTEIASVGIGAYDYIGVQFDGINGNTVQLKNFICVDLTQMFGTTIADYIYTLETGQAGAGVAWFKKLFPKDYYPYNTGELMHVQTSGHKMVGFNQWDEEWEVGAYNSATGAKITVNDRIRSKNFIPVLPNTTYYKNKGLQVYFFDADYNFINWLNLADAGTFTTEGNVHYITFNGLANSGTTYNNDICINLHWDGERDGEYEAYSEHTYPLDSDLVLRGIPKLDSANKLYYDGDTYEADGTVTRYYGTRAYQAGDESLADAITDGTNTVYKLTTPTTETADAFQSPQSVSNWGTEEYIDTRSIPIPVGHNTKYPPDLKAKLETSPNPPDADGDYIVRQTNGVNEYVALSTNATIQNIISRLEALEE